MFLEVNSEEQLKQLEEILFQQEYNNKPEINLRVKYKENIYRYYTTEIDNKWYIAVINE